MGAVNSRMIELARESRGLTQIETAAALSIPQSLLSRIEAKISVPSAELLDRFAALLKYPLDFFYLNEGTHGIGTGALHLLYRRRQGLSARTLKKIEAQVNIARIQISNLLKAAEIREFQSIPTLDPEDFDGDVERIAQSMRATWLIPQGPIENLTQTIERAGGIVIPHDFGTDSVDATSLRVEKLPPLFFVNKNLTGDRLRFTLAHELAHLIMHTVPHPSMEEQADRFASEFLMPGSEIRPALRGLTLPRAAALKPIWKVSIWALMRRARDLDRITENQYKYLCMKMSAMGYRTREPKHLDIRVEEPTVYRDLFDVHRKKLGFTNEDLCRLLVTMPEELENILPERRGLRLVAS
jgi:Zn-dependent peptidase ImmA (M78 family)